MVPGDGPQPAAGMIVGEAPGRKELEAGRPFVGQSGKLLEGVLRALGVRRDEVYITNVVKEMPLDSDGRIRRPYPEEIEAWRSVLLGEIQNVAPAALLALGRTASFVLTGIDGSQAMPGSGEPLIPFGSKIGNVYTAWHPSYLLHQGRKGMDEWLEQIRPWAEAIGRFEYPS